MPHFRICSTQATPAIPFPTTTSFVMRWQLLSYSRLFRERRDCFHDLSNHVFTDPQFPQCFNQVTSHGVEVALLNLQPCVGLGTLRAGVVPRAAEGLGEECEVGAPSGASCLHP